MWFYQNTCPIVIFPWPILVLNMVLLIHIPKLMFEGHDTFICIMHAHSCKNFVSQKEQAFHLSKCKIKCPMSFSKFFHVIPKCHKKINQIFLLYPSITWKRKPFGIYGPKILTLLK